nr:hypothetical protein DXGOKGYL_DXGOKGYL_CDS_0009 [Microvirus sp.]
MLNITTFLAAAAVTAWALTVVVMTIDIIKGWRH